MVTKWLHLEELGGDPWVLPIWSAFAAEKVPPLPKELGELGIHASTRLNLLPRIIARLNDETKALTKPPRSMSLNMCSPTVRPGLLSP